MNSLPGDHLRQELPVALKDDPFLLGLDRLNDPVANTLPLGGTFQTDRRLESQSLSDETAKFAAARGLPRLDL